ncbi:MAG: ExbD/TolR family protein [Flavobacteriales bacterium]
MPKIKVPKSAPSLDMTPTVDLAFLLVTFFMLTAKFRNMEPLEANPPYATSLTQLPEKVMLISIDTAGRAYFDISGREVRDSLIRRMIMGYPNELRLSESDIENFSKMGTFGQPIDRLAAYIQGDADVKEALDEQSKGIPLDSANNQLGQWIIQGYAAYVGHAQVMGISKEELRKDGLRYAIKADANTDYAKVKKVIDVFRDKEIYNFNMVTNLSGSEENADAKLTNH